MPLDELSSISLIVMSTCFGSLLSFVQSPFCIAVAELNGIVNRSNNPAQMSQQIIYAYTRGTHNKSLVWLLLVCTPTGEIIIG